MNSGRPGGMGNLNRSFDAKEIVNKPEIVDEIEGDYLIITDTSLKSASFNNLNKAINILSKKGWKCVNITSALMPGGFTGVRADCYVLMERLS